MTTTTLINGIVRFVNNEVIADQNVCEALLSFDDRAVPAPLTKLYFAFLIGQDKVNILNEDTEACCQKTQITVSMNCYAPPGESAIGVCAYAEDVLERVNAEYAGMMSGYEIGTAVIDDYLKALKIPCKLIFQYEQCPAFNVSDSVIYPFADFMCKTHVLDTDVHLSLADRARFSMPLQFGRYTGLGAEHPVSINLGFRPAMVLLFPINCPAVRLDTTLGSLKNYFDILFDGVHSDMVSITDTGFTVYEPSNIPANASVRTLNESGAYYGYAALKP